MDSMLIWIVMFAGAAIALLAVFLVASEKELKKKRLEFDQLLTKLGDTPVAVGASVPSEAAPDIDTQELDQLRAKIQELERELAAGSSKLQSGENTSDELDLAQRNVEIAQSNAQWLQTTCDELKAQVEDLKSRLEASEGRASDSASGSQGSADRQSQLESEVADLQAQLAANRSQSHDSDAMEHKLANVEAIESNHREEKSSLEAKIAELEKGLSAANAARANEVESIREQLAKSERLQQLMRDERRGLEQEMARWQARVNQAEQRSQQLSALQEPFDNLLAQQSALEERQRAYHEALAGFSQLIAKSNDKSPQAGGFNEFHAGSPVVEARHEPTSNGMHDADTAAVSPAQVIAAAQTTEQPKRRFGLFPVVLALALGGTMAALWSMRGSDTTTTANALPVVSQNKAPDPPAPASLGEPAASEQPPAPPEAPAAKELATPAVKEKAQPARAVEVAKVQRPVAGTYEITQPSRVYATPSELSQMMGDIEPGVRVTVVNSKNGWLEIHSKHGRPPGFIRKENARVLARN